MAIHTAAAPRSPAASARVDIDEASTATVNEWRWHMFMKKSETYEPPLLLPLEPRDARACVTIP